jgi:DNA-binding response OmpR family regulator
MGSRLRNRTLRGMAMKKRIARRVLCIGNDLVNLNLRCALLKEHGLEAVSCGNGHEGIFRFAHGDIHLVILDLDGDGTESALIASELKRQSPRVPIIMLVTGTKTLIAGATAQADIVIVKSEEERELAGCVSRLLKSE